MKIFRIKETNILRITLSFWAAATLGLILFVIAILVLPPAKANADGPDAAYVVIQFDKNSTIVRPISFTAPISGLAALQSTGLNLVISTTASGPIICSIEGVGSSVTDCLVAGYWAYSYWDGSQWQSYAVGAGNSVVNAGALELWSWSPGFVSPATPGGGPQFVAAAKALTWLAGQQSATDGGYGSAGNSIEVLTAIGANGYRGADWRRQPGAPSLSSHVMATGAAYSTGGSTGGAAGAGKLAVGQSAAGDCYPYNSALPQTYYLTSTGVYTARYGAGGAGPQSWGILGTRALSQTVPDQAVSYLKSIINSDGGWGWTPGNSDTNGTALAIQALIAAGEPVTATTIVSGLNYLDVVQNDDGGFPYDPHSSWGAASDANSTAYVIQALLAAGQDPLTGTWVVSNTHPISYLLSLQLNDGSLESQSGKGSSQLATQQAILALLARSFPVRIDDRMTPCAAGFLPVIFKN